MAQSKGTSAHSQSNTSLSDSSGDVAVVIDLAAAGGASNSNGSDKIVNSSNDS